MTKVQELIEAVHASGATIRIEGSDLKIKPAGVLPPELKTRPREHKPELLTLLRLEHLSIRIAIDGKTGDAFLVFSESDAEAARSVAEVYKPFEREWTDAQRRTLRADLEYFERLISRKAAPL